MCMADGFKESLKMKSHLSMRPPKNWNSIGILPKLNFETLKKLTNLITDLIKRPS